MQIVDQTVASVGSEDTAPELYPGRFYSISVYINKHWIVLSSFKNKAIVANVKEPKNRMMERISAFFCWRQLLTRLFFNDFYSCQNYQ